MGEVILDSQNAGMMEYSKKRIALVLADESLRRILSVLIGGSENLNVVAESNDYLNIEGLLWKAKAEVVIMDLQFTDRFNGIELIKQQMRVNPYCRIIVLSHQMESEIVLKALQAGASGYLVKNKNIQFEVVRKLQNFFNGGSALCSRASRIVVESFRVEKSPLTSRETQILELLTQGKTYTEISEELFISKETSKTHIKNIYAKLKVNSKDQAIAKGLEKKIISHPRNRIASKRKKISVFEYAH